MPNPPEKRETGVAIIEAIAWAFTSLVETFGWPGATIILSFGFVVRYATAEQKQRIVETYVLGTGLSKVWPIVIMALVFAATSLAQWRYYKGKIAKLSEEVEREGRAKSLAQEAKIGKRLQHAQTTTAKKKR